MKAYEFLLQLQDETAISILERIPETDRNRTVEKYIIIGDSVVRYASIVTSEESIQQYFRPLIDGLQNLINILKSVPQELKGQIPDTIKATLNETVTRLEAQIGSLEYIYKEASKHTQSAKKGAAACEEVFVSLRETFPDDRFEQVEYKPRFTDILARPFEDFPILIEVKNWTNPVATDEVEKFWRDMEVRNARVGCFISLHTRIQGKSLSLDVETRGSRAGVFVVSAELGYFGHILAYKTARKLAELMRERGPIESEMAVWMNRVLSVHIKEFKEAMKEYEGMQADLGKAMKEITESLQKVSAKMATIRGRLEEIIDLTLKDFPPETIV